MNKNAFLVVLGGFGAGAAAMYFLDPDRGARRRAGVTDKITSAACDLPRAARVTKRDLANRAYGMWAEAQHLFAKEEAPDEVVEARVRSKMGRIVSHPHAIKVASNDGNITLSGPILADETARLLKGIKCVAGVRSVENNLDEHGSPEGISALQGGTRRESRPEFLQENWSPAARFIAGTAGTAALGYGLVKRNALAISLGTLGAALIARSATNTGLHGLLELGRGPAESDPEEPLSPTAQRLVDADGTRTGGARLAPPESVH